MKKILITGVNGFVGHHVAREFMDNGYEVVGLGGPHGRSSDIALTEYHGVNLLEPQELEQVNFKDITAVIHLAGLAAVGPSFDKPLEYISSNAGMEINLFEAAVKQQATPRFLVISSGSLYDPKEDLPLTESSRVNPSSPYAVSKITQEEMAHYYGQRHLEVIIARPFNHIGPGQGLGFIVPDLASQVINFKNNKTSEVLVGNLDAKRDYTDVRDIAHAYRLLIEKGRAGETYNICSGKALSGNEVLQGLIKAAGVNPPISQDPTKMRPADNPIIYGDPTKITTDTGWTPTVAIETTFADVIADWESRS